MDPPIILVDQPTAAPTRKVSAGLAAGAAASLIAWTLNAGFGITMPAGMEATCATLILFGVQYFTRDKAQPPVTTVENPPKETLP